MADLKEMYGVDEQKATEGVWVPLGGGIEVKVARANNPKYQKLITRLLRPHRRVIRRGGDAADLIMEEILTRALSQTILLDWKNVEVDGKPIKYTSDQAYKILTEFRDFRDQITDIADDIELYKEEDDADTEKNSESSLPGQ